MSFRIRDGVLLKYNKEPDETEVIIPEYVRIIGEQAFSCFRHLKQIIIPEGVTEIGKTAFGNCEALESIQLPKSLRSIGNAAFQNCYALKSIHIPEHVTSIGKCAFRDCIQLRDVSLPSAVQRIGNGAFDGTPWEQEIPGDWVILNGNLQKFRDCRAVSVTIPDGVTYINSFAFADCKYLAEITVPQTLKGMGKEAFHGTFWQEHCLSEWNVFNGILYRYSGLSDTAVVPDSVTGIGKGAFLQAHALRRLVLSERIRSIPPAALRYLNAELVFRSGQLEVSIPLRNNWKNADTAYLLKFLCKKEPSDRTALWLKIDANNVKIPLAILLYVLYGNEKALTYLRQYSKRALKSLIQLDNSFGLHRLLQTGFVTKDTIDFYIEYAIGQKALQCQLLLTRYKSDVTGYDEDLFCL